MGIIKIVSQIICNKNKIQEVQGDNYRTILPFKEGQARGVLQDNMANSYNGEDFENGLLHLSMSVMVYYI